MSETTPETTETTETTEQHVARLTVHLRSQQPIVWDSLAYGTAEQYYSELLSTDSQDAVVALNGNRIIEGTTVYEKALVLRSAVVGVELLER